MHGKGGNGWNWTINGRDYPFRGFSLCVSLVLGITHMYTCLHCSRELGVGGVFLCSHPNESLPQWRYKNICDLKNSVTVTSLKRKIYCLQLIYTCSFLWGRDRFLATFNFSGFTFLVAFGFDLVCLWQCLVVYIHKLLNWKCIQTA